jgi:hypothetical protein
MFRLAHATPQLAEIPVHRAFSDRGVVRDAERTARRKAIQICTFRLYSVVHSSHDVPWLFLNIRIETAEGLCLVRYVLHRSK